MSLVTGLREIDASIIGVQPSQTPPSFLGRAAATITVAAVRYHVNPAYLWGIFGAETGYGSDIKTSSAGAIGPFQFEPATAAGLGVTVKNTSHVTDWSAFLREAEGAARLLNQYGYGTNKRLAIERYNAGPGVSPGAVSGYYNDVVKHAQTYRRTGPGGAEAVEREKITESSKAPAGLKTPGGWVGELLAGLGGVVLSGVLLVAGMILVVYGIAVAVRPRDRALALGRS